MKRLVLLLLNLLMPMILFAASNDLCFRHFSVEDGRSSNSVRALMQEIGRASCRERVSLEV